MQKCSYADKYTASEPPKCNGGKGCDACRLKWQARQRAQLRRNLRVRGKGE